MGTTFLPPKVTESDEFCPGKCSCLLFLFRQSALFNVQDDAIGHKWKVHVSTFEVVREQEKALFLQFFARPSGFTHFYKYRC